MSKYNLLDIHEGMGYKEFEDAKEKERLDKHPDKEMIKKVQAMMAKEKATNEGEAVNLAIEASQEKAGIKEDEDEDRKNDEDYEEGWIDNLEETDKYLDESFDSLAKKLDKQKGIDKEEAGKIAGSIAAKKMKGAGKGPTAKQKKRMNEGEVPMELLKAIQKYANEDNGMGFQDALKNIKTALYKLNRETRGRMSETNSDDFYDELEEGAMQPGEGDLESGQTGNMDAYTEEIKGGKVSMKDAVLAIIKDTSATNPEIEMYVDSLTNDIKLNGKEAYADYEVDDYIEDFKEFIGNKSLQEHFGRFMKKYQ